MSAPEEIDFVVNEGRYSYNRKFSTMTRNFNVTFPSVSHTGSQRNFETLFNTFLDTFLKDVPENNKIMIFIDSKNLEHGIQFPCTTRANINLEDIWTTIASIVQSNQTINIDDGLNIQILELEQPFGAG